MSEIEITYLLNALYKLIISALLARIELAKALYTNLFHLSEQSLAALGKGDKVHACNCMRSVSTHLPQFLFIKEFFETNQGLF